MYRLGIVGCGMTGAVTAMLLKQRFPHFSITILEKSRGTGGRMCTSRNTKGYSVDLGAQFITKTTHLTDIQERCYTELLRGGLLEPLHETIEGIKTTKGTNDHFVCPKGSGSLVKYFLHLSGCEALFNHRVVKINLSDEKWLLQCDNGLCHSFEAIILTLPVPQILELDGLQSFLQEDHIKKLKAVEYSSRFALGLFYDENSDYFTSIPYSAKFFTDNPVIRFYSHDNRKRNTNGLPSIVIHTTKEFGKHHINKDPTTAKNIILTEIKKLFPEMPEPSEIKFHKWRYSQVEHNFPDNGCLLPVIKPILICGGDGFAHSTFEGCVLSAECIVQNFINT